MTACRVHLQGGPEDLAGLHARPVGVDDAVQHRRQLKFQDRPAGLHHHPQARVLLRGASPFTDCSVRTAKGGGKKTGHLEILSLYPKTPFSFKLLQHEASTMLAISNLHGNVAHGRTSKLSDALVSASSSAAHEAAIWAKTRRNTASTQAGDEHAALHLQPECKLFASCRSAYLA